MQAKFRHRSPSLEEMEKALWEAGRRRQSPLPRGGLEQRVMSRIARIKAAAAPKTFLELLGGYCWKLAPAAGALLLLLGALEFFRPGDNGDELTVLLTGNDPLIQLLIEEGENP